MQRLQILRAEGRDRSGCDFLFYFLFPAYSIASCLFCCFYLKGGIYGQNSQSDHTKEKKEHKITTRERTRQWAIWNYFKEDGKEEETKTPERQWVRAILLQEMKLWLLSGGTSWVTAGSFCSRPVRGLLAKIPSHLDLAPALAHRWSALVFSLTSSAHSSPSIALFRPPHHLYPSIFHSNMFSPDRKLSFLPQLSPLIPLTISVPRGKSREWVGSFWFCEERPRSKLKMNISARTHSHPQSSTEPRSRTTYCYSIYYLIIC